MGVLQKNVLRTECRCRIHWGHLAHLLELLSDMQLLDIPGFVQEVLDLHGHPPVLPFLPDDALAEVLALHHDADFLLSQSLTPGDQQI